MNKYIYISIGGFIGAITRYMIRSVDLLGYHGSFPLNTLIINITGSLLISFVLTLAIEHWKIDPEIRIGLTAGFLGAYTTFSTLCKEVVVLLQNGSVITALSYMVLSIILGLIAVYVGMIMAKKINRIIQHRKESMQIYITESDVE